MIADDEILTALGLISLTQDAREKVISKFSNII